MIDGLDLLKTLQNLNEKAWNIELENPKAARKICFEIMSKAKNDFPIEKARAQTALGWANISLGNFEEAEKSLLAAEKVFKSFGEIEQELKALNALGYLAHQKEQYELAAKYYNTAILKSDVANLPERKMAAMINLGELAILLGNFEQAKELFSQALLLAVTMENPDEALSACFLNQGIIEYNQNNIEDARAFLENARVVATKCNKKIEQASSLIYLGKILLSDGDFDLSKEFGNNALSIYEALEIPQGQVESLLFLAQVNVNDPDTQKEFIDKALHILQAHANKVLLGQAQKQLSHWYAKQGDYKSAFESHIKHDSLLKNLHTQEISLRLRGIEVKNRLEEAEREAAFFRKHSKDLQRRNEEVTIINEIGRDLTSDLSVQSLSIRLFHHLSQIVPVDILLLGRMIPSKNKLYVDYPIEEGEIQQGYEISLEVGESLSARCIANREILVVNTEEELRNQKQALNPSRRNVVISDSRSILLIPLVRENSVTGILGLICKKPNAFEEYHQKIMEALAFFIAIAQENAQIHEEVNLRNKTILEEKNDLEESFIEASHQARHDVLTGLPNRFMIEEIIENTIQNPRTHHKGAAVLFMDLDGFKPINDTYGHDMGDIILKQVSVRASKLVRGSDVVGRLGGDEFLFLIGVDNRDTLERICQSILTSLGQPFEKDIVMGASIGIATYPNDAPDSKSLIKLADNAMYRAKELGKNQYIFASDLIPN